VAIIIGHGAEAVKQAYPNDDVKWVVQEQQLGTGHAVLCAKNSFGEFAGDILILSGDVPLISERTLSAILHLHRKHNASLTLLTALLGEPRGYGRVLRHADGALAGIVEEQDATDAQQQIEEVNAGIYVASAPFLFSALGKVKNHNEQGEYYLPDTVAIAMKQGERVATMQVDDPREVMGSIPERSSLRWKRHCRNGSIESGWITASR
jgi:bifunctional N-acetylglucosamine-1-phosphate-uridyltransferase/glucosamine-1-phosphate-acetyltransferase GlmU-like protein